MEKKRRSISQDEQCHICGQPESDEHVLRTCPRAKTLWQNLGQDILSTEWCNTPFEDWFIHNISVSFLQEHIPWNIWFGVACWSLWKNRNEGVYNTNELSSRSLFHVVAAKTKAIHWSNANLLETKIKPANFQIMWNPPDDQYVKINVDGAASTHRKMSTAAGLIRNKYGQWRGGFIANIGECIAQKAELWGALYGLRLAWEQGHRHIILEMDNANAVDMLKGNLDQNAHHKNILRPIRALLNRNWSVQICHTLRDGNCCADALAKLAFSFPMGYYRLTEAPSCIELCLRKDAMGVSAGLSPQRTALQASLD